MPKPSTADLCRNLTALLGSLQVLPDPPLLHQAAVNATSEAEAERSERDGHAILYIVVVLLFYSLGIITAIVMYLKREKEEIVEDNAYENYMNFRANPGKVARHFRVQKMVEMLEEVEAGQRRREEEELSRERRATRPAHLGLAEVVVVESSRVVVSNLLRSASPSKLLKTPSWGSSRSVRARSPSRKSQLSLSQSAGSRHSAELSEKGEPPEASGPLLKPPEPSAIVLCISTPAPANVSDAAERELGDKRAKHQVAEEEKATL